MAKAAVKKITKAQAQELARPHVEFLASQGVAEPDMQTVEKAVAAKQVSFWSILGLVVKYGPLAISVLSAVLKVVQSGGKLDAATLLGIVAQFKDNPQVKEILTAILALLGVTLPSGI